MFSLLNHTLLFKHKNIVDIELGNQKIYYNHVTEFDSEKKKKFTKYPQKDLVFF